MAKIDEYYKAKAEKAMKAQQKRDVARQREEDSMMVHLDVVEAAVERDVHKRAQAIEAEKKKGGLQVTTTRKKMTNKLKDIKKDKENFEKADLVTEEIMDMVEKRQEEEESISPAKVIKARDREKIYNIEQNKMVNEYFLSDRTIPLYNKYMCSCCGQLKPIDDFNKSYSFADLSRVDSDLHFHKSICKACSIKLFNYHFHVTAEKNELVAMERWCCDTNTYWDEKCYVEARKAFENDKGPKTIVGCYVWILGRNHLYGLNYWDSPKVRGLVYDRTGKIKIPDIVNNFTAPLDWDKEEIKVKKKIINLMRYDPFENESPEDKKVMYRNLELMIDDAMSDDLMKLKAAIEIVRSYQKIERLRKQEQDLEKEGASPKEIATIADMRNKELSQITVFSRDNGFGDKYASKKSKGVGTLTGCMNEMKERQYEPSLINYYNVSTCKEMQEVANMSMEAIFKQLSLTENEAFQMVATQTKRIGELQEELSRLRENLRYKEIEIKRIQLLYKAKRNNTIEPEDEKKFNEELDNAKFTKLEEKQLLPENWRELDEDTLGGDIDGD